jgi:phage repressor protein C with HTH and peptisase S24 domain
MMMATLGDRLKELRIRRGMSQVALAEKAQVSQTTIASIETGRANGSKHLVAIADALGINYKWLLSGSYKPPEDEDSPSDANRRLLDAAHRGFTSLYPERVWIDRFTYQVSEAGEISWTVDRQAALIVDQRILDEAGTDLADCRALSSAGSGMSPYLLDRDTYVIDTKKTEPREGKVFAVYFAGEPGVKQIYKLPGGGLTLHSLDPTFPDKTLAAEHLKDLIIVGQCIYRAGPT